MLPLRLCAVALLACLATALSVHAAGSTLVEPRSMSFVQANPAPRFTLFYFGSDATAPALLDEMEQAAQQFASNPPAGSAGWQWVSIDCEAEASKGDCTAAGFKAGNSWLFTSTNTEGITAYSGPKDASNISQHARFKFLPSDPAIVLPFVDELSLFERLDAGDVDQPATSKPVFVKFWESWCTHCKSLKLPFEQAAMYFQDQVEFMEIECSKTPEFKSFCSKHAVGSFPTLILFDGEKTVKFSENVRTVVSFNDFFLANLPAERYSSMLQGSSAAPAVARPPASEKKAVESKAAKAKDAAASVPAPATGDKKVDAASLKKSAAKSKKGSSKKAVKREEEEEEEKSDDEEEDRRSTRRRRARGGSRRRRDDDEDEDEEDEEESPRRRRVARSRRSRRRYDDEDEDEEVYDEDDEEDEWDEEDEEEYRAARERRRRARKARMARRRRAAERDGDAAEATQTQPTKADVSSKQSKSKKNRKSKQTTTEAKVPLHTEL